MHVIRYGHDKSGFNPIAIPGGSTLIPGSHYLCTNAMAGALMLYRGDCGNFLENMRPINQHICVWPWYGNSINIEEATDIYLIRGGGFGDLLMLTPTIIALKKKFPEATIHVGMGDKYSGVFDGLGVVEEKLPINTSGAGVEEKGFIIPYEEWIEGHSDAESVHMAQHFANKAGVEIDGCKPFYRVSDEEKAWAAEFPRTRRKRVAIQYMASCLARSYPATTTVAVALATQPDIEVLLFGKPGQIKLPDDCPEGIINMTEHNHTFRQSAAILATCDAVVAPDSAFTHLASALDIPCVGLYGPFPAKLRISGDKAEALQGMAPCSPCYYHATRPTDFPQGKPCYEKGRCVAMESIQPISVVDAVMKIVSPLVSMGV